MDYTKKAYIEKQNKNRRVYEQQGHEVIEAVLKKYYPERSFDIQYTTDDWNKTDLFINGKRIEYKARWWKTQEEVDKYKKEGFLLQADKIENNDVFFYYIQFTKELYMISTVHLIEKINEGKIKTTNTTCNKFQFVPEAGKQQVFNYIVPVDCFDKVFYL